MDSIGIEIAGKAYGIKGKTVEEYENVNPQQNASLKWFVSELLNSMIFQHLRCTDILMWAEKMKQKRAQHHGKDEIHSVTFNRYYA